MPVLARTLEAAGLSTLLITPMPYWAERVGTPRTLAIEYPFGHTLGMPGNAEMQHQILLEALQVLASAVKAGTVQHSKQQWPEPAEEAIRRWQPREASPIITELTPKFRDMLRHRRKS